MSKTTRKTKRKKLWSVPRIRDPRHPGYTVRITELGPGGRLYAVWMENGRQVMRSLKGVVRADLGADEKAQEAQARIYACGFIEALAKQDALPPGGRGLPGARLAPRAEAEVLTLGRLADLYEQRGSLTAQPKYRTEQVARVLQARGACGSGAAGCFSRSERRGCVGRTPARAGRPTGHHRRRHRRARDRIELGLCGATV